MAMFDTSITTGVAAQQQVAPIQNNMGANLMAVAGAVEEVYTQGKNLNTRKGIREEFQGVEKELQDLDGQLASISSTFDKNLVSGSKKAQLQAKARAIVSKAKANNPALAQEIDTTYSTYFGGSSGSGGGSFGLSPEEEAASKAQEALSKESFETGIPVDQLQRINGAKKQAEGLKALQEVNASNVGGVTSGLITGMQADLQTSVATLLKDNPTGTLDAETLVGLNGDLDRKALELKNQIRTKARLPDGSLAISQTELDKQMASVDKSVSNMKTMLKDSSYRTFLEEANATKNAEVTKVAYDTAPELKFIKETFGEQIASQYVNAQLFQNKAQLALFNDMFGDAFPALRDPTSMHTEVVKFGSYLKGNTEVEPTDAGAAATAHIAATNPTSAFTTNLFQGYTEPKAIQRMTKANPDAMMKVVTVPYKLESTERTEGTKAVYDEMNMALASMVRNASGSFPSGITVTFQQELPREAQIRGIKPSGKEYTVRGAQVTPEIEMQINKLIAVAKANPSILGGRDIETFINETINRGTHINNLPDPAETKAAAEEAMASGSVEGIEMGGLTVPKAVSDFFASLEEPTMTDGGLSGEDGKLWRSMKESFKEISEAQNPSTKKATQVAAPEMTAKERAAFEEWAQEGVTPEDIEQEMAGATYVAPPVKGDKGGVRPQALLDNANIVGRYKQYLESI